MANLNKVMLIGRLTRDPEVRTFPNGGKVAKFGFAVNNRKKNQTTGLYEDVPVFLDVEAFNRGETGKQADMVEKWLVKGRQVFIEGSLRMDQWVSQQDNQKRSKIVVVLDNMQFLEPAPQGQGQEGMGSGGGGATRQASAPPQQRRGPAPAPAAPQQMYEETTDFGDEHMDLPDRGNEGDIPF